MVVPPKTVYLPVGAVVLRSAVPADAAEVVRCHRMAAAETHFLSRYPDEVESDPGPMRLELSQLAEHPRSFDLAAFLDGEAVGDLGVVQCRGGRKTRHRASVGISILARCCGLGLGRAMLTLAVAQARENGFSQLELGVFADNARALHLYESLGFRRIGAMPRAFRLDDGTVRDELLLVLDLENGG